MKTTMKEFHMKTAKKSKTTKLNKSGMTDAAKAEWRAAKSAQLDGRVAALKKLNAPTSPTSPTATATAKPKRAHPAPADAPGTAEVATPDAPVNDAPVVEQRPARDGETGGTADKPKRTPKGERKPRESGCLNIAAKLLAESKEPMTTKALIDAMAARGLWTSPGGKTPAATLYAAIVREITTKGDAARFRKMDRGLFAAKM